MRPLSLQGAMVEVMSRWWWQILNPDTDGLHVFEPAPKREGNTRAGGGAIPGGRQGAKLQGFARETAAESSWWNREEARKKTPKGLGCFKVVSVLGFSLHMKIIFLVVALWKGGGREK
jgi:hypothetical protein